MRYLEKNTIEIIIVSVIFLFQEIRHVSIIFCNITFIYFHFNGNIDINKGVLRINLLSKEVPYDCQWCWKKRKKLSWILVHTALVQVIHVDLVICVRSSLPPNPSMCTSHFSSSSKMFLTTSWSCIALFLFLATMSQVKMFSFKYA